MKLLVTGGAGFIGSNFVHYWHKNHPDDKITILDPLTYAGNLNNINSLLLDINFIKGDITDPQAVQQAVQGQDAVVHFAAESRVDRSITNPERFLTTNVLGTHVLLEAARKNSLRFHHVSTDEVYGHIELTENRKWTELDPYAPRSPYSASKAASDHLVRAYFHTYNLPVTITNCANNIGPYTFPEKLVPLAATNLLEGKKVPVYKPGNQVREWLYVDDHCSAIDAVLNNGKLGETYFVGPDNPELSNLEVVKIILEIMDKDETWIDYVADRPGHDQKYSLDHTKISKQLNWQPKYKLKEALDLTVKWYINHPEWWMPLKQKP